MLALTQCYSIMDRECTATTGPKLINVAPKCCLFQYPIVPTSQIVTEFKISCQQLLPIHISNNLSPTGLEETTRQCIFQIVHNGQFTGRDYDGTKYDGWFGPKNIDLYLSWLLLTNRIHIKSLDDIMDLPYTIFGEFENNNDNNTDNLTSSM